MDFLSITSRDNALIKLVCALQSSARERRKSALFVLEGLRICKDALENGIKFDKLIISQTAEKRLEGDVKRLALNAAVCYKVPDGLFEKMAQTESPQGIIAVAKIPELQVKIDKNGRYIGLQNVSDPSNLGAVARTAESLGISGILVSSDSCDPYSPKALRASMGTLLRMPIFLCENLLETIKDSGLNPYACVVDANAKPINTVNFSDGDILLIGNEANGLTEEIKSQCVNITIPMSGRAESLNAAAAAAIAMWEMVKNEVFDLDAIRAVGR